MRLRRATAAIAGVVVALALSACDVPGSAPGAATANDVAALPDCGPPPSPAPDEIPAGAIIPPDTRVTAVREVDLVQLNGYVPAVPDAVVEAIRARPGVEVTAWGGDSRVRELRVEHGSWSVYLKVRAICSTASLLTELIAPADADDRLPAPGDVTADPA